MKTKKIISIVLVLAVMLGVFTTIFSFSASAVLNEDGTYTPGKGVETNTYHFILPYKWHSQQRENEDFSWLEGKGYAAGIYWDEGTDACGPNAKGPIWPGYKATYQPDMLSSDDPNFVASALFFSHFYVDIPKNVPSIIWNNYVDNSKITDGSASSVAYKTPIIGVGADHGYHEGDGTYYDSLDGFWDFVNNAWENDKDLLDENAECFEEGSNGLTMTFNNMVYVIEEEITSDGGNSKVYKGEWYFLYHSGYGAGYYGSWPTREMAKEQAAKGNGIYTNFVDAEGPYDLDSEDPTEEPTQDPTSAPTTQPPTNEPTKPTVQPKTEPTHQPSTNSNSSTNSNAVTTNHSAVQTGSASYAVTLLILLVAVASVVLLIRKKKTD